MVALVPSFGRSPLRAWRVAQWHSTARTCGVWCVTCVLKAAEETRVAPPFHQRAPEWAWRRWALPIVRLRSSVADRAQLVSKRAYRHRGTDGHSLGACDHRDTEMLCNHIAHVVLLSDHIGQGVVRISGTSTRAEWTATRCGAQGKPPIVRRPRSCLRCVTPPRASSASAVHVSVHVVPTRTKSCVPYGAACEAASSACFLVLKRAASDIIAIRRRVCRWTSTSATVYAACS